MLFHQRVPETFFISWNNLIRDCAAAAIGAKVEQHLCARPKGIQDHSEWLRTAHGMTLPTVKHVRILQRSLSAYATVGTFMTSNSMTCKQQMSLS